MCWKREVPVNVVVYADVVVLRRNRVGLPDIQYSCTQKGRLWIIKLTKKKECANRPKPLDHSSLDNWACNKRSVALFEVIHCDCIREYRVTRMDDPRSSHQS
jgi:hypothetical protein